MADYSTQDIRNVALIGHADSGKTTFADTVLEVAGVVDRAGSVDDGTSVLDFDDGERERKHSIYAAVARAPWKDKQVNLIDTPGYPDFIGSAAAGTAAADVALLCVSAAAGLGINTRRTWDVAGQYGMPRAVLLTKLDADGADYANVLAQVQEAFGRSCIPVLVPDGAGGVTNLLTGEGEGRQELIETIAESDDELMMKYLEDEELTEQELSDAFVGAIAAGSVVPVLCCAAAKGMGVAEVLDVIAAFFPGPSRRVNLPVHLPGNPEEAAEVPPLDGPLSAFVFKVVTDPFVGKIAFFRVVSGRADTSGCRIARTDSKVRVNGVYHPQGKEQEPADAIIAGDIGTVTKIEEITLGDTLLGDGAELEFGHFAVPTPMVSLAVFPKSRGDEGRISTSLQKLTEEDPAFRFERDRQTNELVVRGASSLHLDVTLGRMKSRYNVDVETKVPEVPYLETITGTADASYRHKKQTGGRGQFGEVYMRIEPNERGEGLEFLDEVVGGAIPKNLLPAVEKGIRETMQRGVVAGYPVVDVKAHVYDGKDHPVDSDEASFKIAGARCFSQAVLQANPVLLEPIVRFEVIVPSRFVGDITSDMSGRRGRISDTGVVGDMQLIAGEIPLAEIQTYSTELRSMTGGEGSYTIEFDRYDVMPRNIQEQVVARAKAKREEDS
ncbi:MAG: elongation factor G [Planctomycetota bacterium]